MQQLCYRGILARIGGPGFVAQPMSKINLVTHFEIHCRILQEQYARRVIIKAGIEVAAHGYDDISDLLQLLADAHTHLTTFYCSLETRPSKTATEESTFAHLAQSVGQYGLTGVTAGLTALDGLTGGWHSASSF